MKPRQTFPYGIRTRKEFFPPNSYTESVGGCPLYYDYLTGIVSVNGDHKSVNPHQYLRGLEGSWRGFVRSEYPSGQYTEYEGWITPSSKTFSVNSSGLAYAQAVDRLYERLRGGVDLSIDLIQAGKTSDMVKLGLSIVRNYKDTFDRLKRLNPRDIGAAYLTWVYGIKPTLSTMFELLQSNLTSGSNWIRVEARGSDRYVKVEEEFVLGCPCLFKQKVSDGCRLVVNYGPRESFLQELSGYTSLNPLSIAYEALPYSFVLDWLVDFGGYIRNLETASVFNSSFVSGYRIDSTRVDVVGTGAGSFENGGAITSYTLTLSGNTQRFNRRPLGSTPFPDPPIVKTSLGVSRMISAASLLSQQIKSWEVRLPREHRFR